MAASDKSANKCVEARNKETEKKMKEAKITLWGAGTARTIRPIWMAEEMGIAYELKPIGPRTGETQTPEYTQMTRKQKVPFMQSDEVSLSESLAICRYMQMIFAPGALYVPEDTATRAKEDEWCLYVYGELDETSLYVMRRHYDLADIYGEAPQAVGVARAYLQRHFAVIDAHLAAHETLLPSGFGLADIMLMSCLDWAVFYGEDLPKDVGAYRKRHAARPAYKKAMAINYANLPEVLDGTAWGNKSSGSDQHGVGTGIDHDVGRPGRGGHQNRALSWRTGAPYGGPA